MSILNSTVPCKVIPMPNGLYRKSRRGVPECKAGVTLYYLWHEPTGLYFKECYTDRVYAVRKATRTTGPRSMSDVAEAWVTDTKLCEHSYRTQDEDDNDHS